MASRFIEISNISNKDFAVSGELLYAKTPAYISTEAGNAPAVGATPATVPSDLGRNAILIENWDDLTRYWTYDAATTSWSHDGDVSFAGVSATGSNIGTDGVGVFDGKVLNDLQFRNLESTNPMLTIALDPVENDIEFTVVNSAIDHGSLAGLADDDHTQYHNDARGDARYYTQALLNGGQLNTLYYTETEIDNFFEGESGGKKQVDWARLTSVPATFAPSAHTHTLSEVTDVTSTAAEVNLLDLSGLTAGWVLSADTATTASWKQLAGSNINNDLSWTDYSSSDFDTDLATKDTDDLAEGATNLYFTPAERSKLAGITAGAEANVNADWNAVSGDAQILNKPTIPTVDNTVYGAPWNGNLDAPTKNAVYDKIESLTASDIDSIPFTTIAATDVQNALEEIHGELTTAITNNDSDISALDSRVTTLEDELNTDPLLVANIGTH